MGRKDNFGMQYNLHICKYTHQIIDWIAEQKRQFSVIGCMKEKETLFRKKSHGCCLSRFTIVKEGTKPEIVTIFFENANFPCHELCSEINLSGFISIGL